MLQPAPTKWQKKLFQIIYEADTKAGRYFDLWLLVLIVASIILLALETVPGFAPSVYTFFYIGEGIITFLFTIEYILRLVCVKKHSAYVFSAFGVIDLLSILPLYLGLLFPAVHYMMVWRALRLLRVFRILKLGRFLKDANILSMALLASRRKIIIFFLSLLVYVLIFGTLMYIIEGPENGFTSIPTGVYWAVVTMTTTGFGDIVPKTMIGKTISTFVMLMGYSILAVPTGIVSAEMARAGASPFPYTKDPAAPPHQGYPPCSHCGSDTHRKEAKFCDDCGKPLQ